MECARCHAGNRDGARFCIACALRGARALVEAERAGADLLADLGTLGDERAVIPAIVYAELQVGVRMADTPARARARRERIDALVTRLPVVEFDRAIADRWSDLFAGTSKAGTTLPSNDLAVAATALFLGFAVLLGSRGESHFERVPGYRLCDSENAPRDAHDALECASCAPRFPSTAVF